MTPEEVEVLRRLKELWDEGIISDAEFEAQKQMVLFKDSVMVTPPRAEETLQRSSNALSEGVDRSRNDRDTVTSSGREGASSFSRVVESDTEVVVSWNQKVLPLMRRRRTFLFLGMLLMIGAIPLFCVGGADSFNRSAVESEIVSLFPDVSPTDREGYREFVKSACQWNETEKMAFAESRVSEFELSESLALDFFRSFDGLEDFKRLVTIGCGFSQAEEISEALTVGSGTLVPKAFVTPGDMYIYESKCSENDPQETRDFCVQTKDDFDSYLPEDDLSLRYGDFSPNHRMFTAWWRTVFAEVESPSGSITTVRPDAEFKFWKRVRVDDQFEYFFCVQRDDVCETNGFLRLYWEDRAWVFVGLGTISQVESGLGSPGKLLVEPVQGGAPYRNGDSDLGCEDFEDQPDVCFIYRPIALITSGQDDQAFLLNVKSNFVRPRENAISLDKMAVFDGSKNYGLLPCRLDADGSFIRYAGMVFLDRNPFSKYIFDDGFRTNSMMFDDKYLPVSAFGDEVNFLMCLDKKGSRPQFRSAQLQISAPLLAETEGGSQWIPDRKPSVDIELNCQVSVEPSSGGCFDLRPL